MFANTEHTSIAGAQAPIKTVHQLLIAAISTIATEEAFKKRLYEVKQHPSGIFTFTSLLEAKKGSKFGQILAKHVEKSKDVPQFFKQAIRAAQLNDINERRELHKLMESTAQDMESVVLLFIAHAYLAIDAYMGKKLTEYQEYVNKLKPSHDLSANETYELAFIHTYLYSKCNDQQHLLDARKHLSVATKAGMPNKSLFQALTTEICIRNCNDGKFDEALQDFERSVINPSWKDNEELYITLLILQSSANGLPNPKQGEYRLRRGASLFEGNSNMSTFLKSIHRIYKALFIHQDEESIIHDMLIGLHHLSALMDDVAQPKQRWITMLTCLLFEQRLLRLVDEKLQQDEEKNLNAVADGFTLLLQKMNELLGYEPAILANTLHIDWKAPQSLVLGVGSYTRILDAYIKHNNDEVHTKHVVLKASVQNLEDLLELEEFNASTKEIILDEIWRVAVSMQAVSASTSDISLFWSNKVGTLSIQ